MRTSTTVLAAAALALAAAALEPASASAAPSSAIRPSLTATFAATSYAPGQLARLRVRGPARRLELQILRAGAERAWSSVGRPWGPARALRFRRAGRNTVLVRTGAWPSGLYFARLTAPGLSRALEHERIAPSFPPAVDRVEERVRQLDAQRGAEHL